MPKPIPTLEQELRQCERDYVEFVHKYSSGDVAECCRIAKVDEGEWALLMNKHRLGVKAKPAPKPAPVKRVPGTSKRSRILVACAQPHTAKALHLVIGGSYNALGVELARMKAEGLLAVASEARPSRYRTV